MQQKSKEEDNKPLDKMIGLDPGKKMLRPMIEDDGALKKKLTRYRYVLNKEKRKTVQIEKLE